MGKLSFTFVSVIFCIAGLGTSTADEIDDQWPYDPSPLFPFGRPNPEQTDPEARIFDAMIGIHQCQHERINYETKETIKADAVWSWYYDMNGHGVRDIYRYGKGAPASQRVFNPETKQWHVWYFIGQGFYYAGEWVGGAKDDLLVFEKANEVLGGRKMRSRLEYYDITENSFKWKSSNIDNETGEVFVDWKIDCQRRNF